MRSHSGTIRRIISNHNWDKLERYTQLAYSP
jgi:hypothetical protein